VLTRATETVAEASKRRTVKRIPTRRAERVARVMIETGFTVIGFDLINGEYVSSVLNPARFDVAKSWRDVRECDMPRSGP
jgi:hypothetical protein